MYLFVSLRTLHYMCCETLSSCLLGRINTVDNVVYKEKKIGIPKKRKKKIYLEIFFLEKYSIIYKSYDKQLIYTGL